MKIDNQAEYVRLSSRITLFYKVILPGTVLVILVGALLYFWGDDAFYDTVVPIVAYFGALWLLLVFIGVKVCHVYYSYENILIKNFSFSNSHGLSDVHSISRYYINFYRLKLVSGKTYIFIPHITEAIMPSFKDIDSILKFKKQAGRA